MDRKSCLTGILVVCLSRYFWATLTDLGMALLKTHRLGEEERVKAVLKSWIVFSLCVVAPRTPSQAPPPLEFTDAPLSNNHASVSSISTNSSLFRLKFSMPEDCLRLNSFCKLSSLSSSAISENKMRRKILVLLRSKPNHSSLPWNKTLLWNTEMSTMGRNMYRSCSMRKGQNRSIKISSHCNFESDQTT